MGPRKGHCNGGDGSTMPRENDGIVIHNDSSLSRNAPKGALQWWRRVHDATRKGWHRDCCDDSSVSRIKLQWWRRVSLASMPRENDGIVTHNDSSLSRNAPKGALQWWRRVLDATRK